MDIDLIQQWVEQTWWPFVQSATLASLVVLLVVAVTWIAIRRNASAHLGYALFLLPLIPFVVPLSGIATWEVALDLPSGGPWGSGPAEVAELDAPASVHVLGNVVPPAVGEVPRAGAGEFSSVAGSFGASSAGSKGASDPGANLWSFPSLVLLLWLSTVAWLACRWMLWQYRTQRLARDARVLQDPRLRLLVRRTAQEAGLRRVPRMVESPRVHAPAVCGMWRPTLLLPVGLGDVLDDDALAWSLHHEFAHLRRKDLGVASFQRALQILWWFHPLVWVLNRIVAELRECACDEAALARMPELSRRRAADALVDLVESSQRAGRQPLALESLYSHRQSLEKRIMRLIDKRYVCRPGLTPMAGIFLALTAGVGFASTQVRLTNSGEPEPEPRFELVAERLQEPEEIEEELEVIEEAVEPDELLEEVEVVEVELDSNGRAGQAIARSLDWIVSKQLMNGSWETGDPRYDMAGEFNSVGVTALAIECLLDSDVSAHREATRRGLKWLQSVQDPELGLFGTQKGFGFQSGHAQATRVWFIAHRGQLEGERLEVAKRAVSFIEKARNPYAAWRFDFPPIGDNDSFVTSLMLRALSEARRAGVEFDPSAIQDGTRLLDELTDPTTGRTGYVTIGGAPGRLATKRDDFPIEYTEYPTAMAIAARLDLGEDPVESSVIMSGSGLLIRLTPDWDPVKGKNDGYYWMYGTEALSQLGGVWWEHWQRDLYEALIENQRPDGSWPKVDAWSAHSESVHIACVYTRALQLASRE